MLVVMVIGTFTAIYAAYIAITQNDIKKVIAYSTVSSLGFMFLALGAGAWAAGIFYLFAHGFFKGLLFLVLGLGDPRHGRRAGHAQDGRAAQAHPGHLLDDARRRDRAHRRLPLRRLLGQGRDPGRRLRAGGYYVVWVVGIVTAFLTAVFTFRLIFMTFFGECRADEEVQQHIHESPKVMTIPLVLLAIPSMALGLLAGFPPEGGWIHTFLEPVFFEVEHEEFAWLGEGGGLMLFSVAVALLGVYLAYVMYIRRDRAAGELAATLPGGLSASLNKLYMDEVYEKVPIRSTIAFAGWLWTFVDVKVIDGAVNGLAWLWGWFGGRAAAAADRARPELRLRDLRRHGAARRRRRGLEGVT